MATERQFRSSIISVPAQERFLDIVTAENGAEYSQKLRKLFYVNDKASSLSHEHFQKMVIAAAVTLGVSFVNPLVGFLLTTEIARQEALYFMHDGRASESLNELKIEIVDKSKS